MKTHVFVTRPIPSEGLALLKKNRRIDLEVYEHDKKIPRATLLKRVKGKDVILSILTDRIDREVFEAAGPQLKLVANYAVGFDNIDLKEAASRNITITNAPSDQIVESVAEHTIALMLALAHRIVEGDAFTRAGKYTAWGPQLLLGTDLFKKTVGIIGTGRIGTGVVRRLHDGFGMKVIYHDLERNKELEKNTGAKFKTQHALLKEADFVSLHVPLLPSTRHLISKEELALMKPTAFLINTSRGPIVDEKALTKALKKGRLAGAGLDVYECEPLIDCDPTDNLELRTLPNVVLTPHTASATLETRQAMSRVAAQNILDVVSGRAARNRIR